jgi:putative exporter of polyketide antibiotics
VPKVLLDDQVEIAPLVGLLVVAALLVFAGVRAFTRRDLG